MQGIAAFVADAAHTAILITGCPRGTFSKRFSGYLSAGEVKYKITRVIAKVCYPYYKKRTCEASCFATAVLQMAPGYLGIPGGYLGDTWGYPGDTWGIPGGYLGGT